MSVFSRTASARLSARSGINHIAKRLAVSTDAAAQYIYGAVPVVANDSTPAGMVPAGTATVFRMSAFNGGTSHASGLRPVELPALRCLGEAA